MTIKTWHQRCMEHPDHKAGVVWEGMIRARMCEEIEELRAEIERLRVRMAMLKGLFDACDKLIERARAALAAVEAEDGR